MRRFAGNLSRGTEKDWSVKVLSVERVAHCHLPAVEPKPNTRAPPPHAALRRHVKDEHVKNVAQDVAQDVAEDVAEDVLGAAEDGSVKVLI